MNNWAKILQCAHIYIFALHFHTYTTCQQRKQKKMYRHKMQNAVANDDRCISIDRLSILKYKSCQLLTWNKISNKSNIQKSLIQSVIGKKVVSHHSLCCLPSPKSHRQALSTIYAKTKSATSISTSIVRNCNVQ